MTAALLNQLVDMMSPNRHHTASEWRLMGARLMQMAAACRKSGSSDKTFVGYSQYCEARAVRIEGLANTIHMKGVA